MVRGCNTWFWGFWHSPWLHLASSSALSAMMRIYCEKLGCHPWLLPLFLSSSNIHSCTNSDSSNIFLEAMPSHPHIGCQVVIQSWTTSKLTWLPLVPFPIQPILCSVTMKSKSDQATSLIKHVIDLPLPIERRTKSLHGPPDPMRSAPHLPTASPPTSISSLTSHFRWQQH